MREMAIQSARKFSRPQFFTDRASERSERRFAILRLTHALRLGGSSKPSIQGLSHGILPFKMHVLSDALVLCALKLCSALKRAQASPSPVLHTSNRERLKAGSAREFNDSWTRRPARVVRPRSTRPPLSSLASHRMAVALAATGLCPLAAT